MIDFLIILLVAVIIGAIVFYIRREKKKGARCIGCPHAGTCSGHCSGGSDSCGCPTDSN